MFEEADLIFSYSRAEAIRDGVPIDVSARAKLLGYRIPAAPPLHSMRRLPPMRTTRWKQARAKPFASYLCQ